MFGPTCVGGQVFRAVRDFPAAPVAATPYGDAMTTVAETVPRRARKGIRLGLWAMICGIVAPVWAVAAILLALRSSSQHDFPDQPALMPEWATVPVYIFATLGTVAVPIAIIVAILLGIFAIVLNRRAGQVMGGIGLLVILLSVIGVVALIGVFIQLFVNISG